MYAPFNLCIYPSIDAMHLCSYIFSSLNILLTETCFCQAIVKHGKITNAMDMCWQTDGGNVVGVLERLLAGWDVNKKDVTTGFFAGGVSKCLNKVLLCSPHGVVDDPKSHVPCRKL